MKDRSAQSSRLHRRRAAARCCCAVLLGIAALPAAAAGENLAPLVQTDLELRDWLARADHRIDQGDFTQAIQILQALLERDDVGFVKDPDHPGRFLPLSEQVAAKIASLPPEALQRYRRLYDPKARQKLHDALQAGDLRALELILQRYGQTSLGPQVRSALAERLFDRGLFRRAASLWQQQRPHTPDDDLPALLARIALASHLAGLPEKARQAAEELRKHPRPIGVLAGREQNLPDAVQQLLKTEPPARVATGRASPAGWSSPGGTLPDPTDCNAVLLPRWRYPADLQRELAGLLIDPTAHTNDRYNKNSQAELTGGHVRIHHQQGKKRSIISAPAMLRPVVADDTVLLRTEDAVLALDFWTGRLRWRADLPLQADPSEIKQPHQRIVFGRFPRAFRGLSFFDRGQFSLSVGGGMVFTTYRFAPPVRIIGPGRSFQTPEGSCLAALSLPAEGKLLWTLGDGAGSDELLKHGTYLGPPTYSPEAGGRLYALLLHTDTYHLLCLRAQTGELLWKRQVAQTPTPQTRGLASSLADLYRTIATPPALLGDRLVLATNAGVIACYQADTGQPLWAMQYPSTLQSQQRPYLPPGENPAMISLVNPLLLAGDTLLALPADSESALGLDLQTGRTRWKTPRDGLLHMTLAGPQSLLLTGGGLKLLDTEDGSVRHAAMNLDTPPGRPAIAGESILLSGDGQLWEIDRNTFTRRARALEDPDALLGNLLTVNGKLLAANTAGLCAYFHYADALAEMSRRIRNAKGPEHIELLFQRAQLGLATAHPDQALEDFRALEHLIDSLPNPDHAETLRQRIRPLRYRALVIRGNRTEDLQARQDDFDRAMKLARTHQERGHMLLRLAKLAEQRNDFPRAVRLAQQLATELPTEPLVDVRLGPDARLHLDDHHLPRLQGYQLATGLVERLIEIHGRDIYAAFDADARTALDAAIARDDPADILAVLHRYPHTRYRDEAEFVAAEASFRKARQSAGQPAQLLLAQAEELLRRIAARRSSDRRPSALLALAALYQANGRDISAKRTLLDLRGLDPKTPIAFADLKGPLGEVLEDLREGKLDLVRTGLEETRRITPPVHPTFSIPAGRLLTDATGQPLTLGSLVLVQADDRTLLVDTAASNADAALAGEALTGIDARLAYLTAGASADRSVIAVYGGGTLTAFAADTGKLLWTRDTRDLDLTLIAHAAVLPHAILLIDAGGQIQSRNLRDGSLLWRSVIPPDHHGVKPFGWPLARHGLLLLPREGKHLALALDLQNGKCLYEQRSHQNNITGLATLSGRRLLAACPRGPNRKGQLQLLKLPHGNITRQHYHDDLRQPHILAALDKTVVLRPARNASALAMFNPDLPASARQALRFVPLSPRPNTLRVPVECAYDGKHLFVLASEKPVPPKQDQPTTSPVAVRPTLLSADLATGKVKHLLPLPLPDKSADTPQIVRQLLTGEDHVLVVYYPSGDPSRCRLAVIGKANGSLVQTLDNAAAVALTNGRLAVQHDEGVTVYGGP